MAGMRTILSVAMVAGVAGAAASVALGQNALGDGRVLDANLSRTQGPVNPRVNTLNEQMRFNNAIVTGQAGGGKSFRGTVGYGAVDAFRSTTSGDALYNFQRDSTISAYTGAGIRASDALRYQFALTTNQAVPSFLAQTAISRPAGQVSTAESIGSTSSALRSTADFTTGQTFRPTLVGTRQDEWGAEYVAKASPLIGVSWVKVAESPLYASNVTGLSTSQQAAAVAGDPSTPKNYAPGSEPPVQPGAQPVAPPVTPLAPGLTGLETASRHVTPTLDRDSLVAARRVDPLPVTFHSEMRGELDNRFKLAATPEGGPKTPNINAPTEPVTLDMQMERLRRMLRGEPMPKQGEEKPRLNPDGTTIPPTPEPKKDPNSPEKPVDDKSDPTKTPLPLGMPDQKDLPPIQSREQPGDAITPQMLRGMRQLADTRLETLVRIGGDANTQIKDPQAYSTFMQDGQALLASGKFFASEDRFTRALSSMTGDPMARVGRMHAQLGAGLYLSAAANLRGLIAEHPELVATRYGQNLLPQPERTQKIVEQLKDEMSRTRSSMTREAALLVAYLGYQQDSAETIKFGLDEFQGRVDPSEAGVPDRTLVELLRKAWVVK